MALKPQVSMDVGEFLIDINVDDSLSNAIRFDNWRGSLQTIIIDGPGAFTGTAKVQESFSQEDTDEYGTTWRDMQSGGSDITVPADGSVRITVTGFRRLRISSSGNETVNRRFKVRGIEAAA